MTAHIAHRIIERKDKRFAVLVFRRVDMSISHMAPMLAQGYTPLINIYSKLKRILLHTCAESPQMALRTYQL